MFTIRCQTVEFKRGTTSIFDDKNLSRPNQVTKPEMVDKIHGMTVHNRAEAGTISTEWVLKILHKYLGMRSSLPGGCRICSVEIVDS